MGSVGGAGGGVGGVTAAKVGGRPAPGAYFARIDSLTQIVLGAAVGELAAGRRLGNRAMIWGAVAGTIPDFDVAAGLVADPVTNLAFHRCVTHSLYFAALVSPVLAWMARALYARDGQPRGGYPWRTWLPGALAVYAVVVAGSFASPTPLRGVWAYAAVVAGVTAAYPLLVWAFRRLRPRRSGPQVGYRHWLALFALGIGTHPLLDCFTTYGTQVLQPFDDLRVAWNTISVADPAYTLPLLALLLVASRALRQNAWRRRLTWAGLAVSTAYLAFTVYNLTRVRAQVARDLAEARVPYERFHATPTLLQNVLWSVTVDQGDTLLATRIGLLDEPFRLPLDYARGGLTDEVLAFPQRDRLLDPIRDERAVRVATWFSDGYYAVSRAAGDTLELVDLRFGVLPAEGASPVFGFQFYPPEAAGAEWGFRQRPFRDDLDAGELFGSLWRRIWGRD